MIKLKAFHLFLSILITTFAFAQNTPNYNITYPNGKAHMTEEVLMNYLHRSITMQGLTEAIHTWSCRSNPNNTSPYLDLNSYNEDIDMLANIDAKFIGRVAGLWGGEWKLCDDSYFVALENTIQAIRQKYQQLNRTDMPIVQAAIFEIITADVVKRPIEIPDYVFQDLGIPLPPPPIPPNTPRTFNHLNIRGNNTTRDNTDKGIFVPDLCSEEGRMWVYYLATQYINSGVEALHIGQIETMYPKDAPCWGTIHSLFQAIRDYAHRRYINSSTPNTRGFVLIDAHTYGAKHTLPNGHEQLLFDFHSGVLPIRNVDPNNTGGWADRLANLNGGPALLGLGWGGCHSDGIFNNSIGGTTYFGWTTDKLPYLMEFDNFGATANVNIYNNTDPACNPYGWDQITWFAKQAGIDGSGVTIRTSETYSNNWLKYAYQKLKCGDSKALLQVTGRRTTVPKNCTVWAPGIVYRAANAAIRVENTPCAVPGISNGGQENTIKELWDGHTDNFSFEQVNFNQNVAPSPPTTLAVGGTIRVGEDKIYYVDVHGAIQGYVKSLGVWKTVSPTWAAHRYHGKKGDNNQLQANQIPAQNHATYGVNLVASPDGQFLYYIGTNGRVYGFKINSIWDYSYIHDIPTDPNVNVQCGLICPSNNRMYYVGTDQRIHGFHKTSTNWATTSPSWGANSSTPVANQVLAFGGKKPLACNPSVNRLYYVGIDNNMHSYEIDPINPWAATYDPTPLPNQSNLSILPEIICPANDLIFYTAIDGNKVLLHGFTINTQGNWVTTSPSWAATIGTNPTPIGNQVFPFGSLTMSPDLSHLYFLGFDGKIHDFEVGDNFYQYRYNSYSPQLQTTSRGYLAMNSTDEIFFVNSTSEIDLLKLTENPCYSPNITIPLEEGGEPGFDPLNPTGRHATYYRTAVSSSNSIDQQPWGLDHSNSYDSNTEGLYSNTPNLISDRKDFDFNVYPNPTSGSFNVELPKIEGKCNIEVTTAVGQVIYSIENPNNTLINIDLKDNAKGIYFVKVFMDDTNQVKKIILQ